MTSGPALSSSNCYWELAKSPARLQRGTTHTDTHPQITVEDINNGPERIP